MIIIATNKEISDHRVENLIHNYLFNPNVTTFGYSHQGEVIPVYKKDSHLKIEDFRYTYIIHGEINNKAEENKDSV